ncbi:Pyrimidine/purine nucleoside phosphorylase, partial [Bienertia sinuspersici]
LLYGWDKGALMEFFKKLSDQLGIWAIPAYVGVHTLTLPLCLPSTVFFEVGASLLLGFFPAYSGCKITSIFKFSPTAWSMMAGHSFLLLGFLLFPLMSSIMHLLPLRSDFFVDFLLPTIIGCLLMILQNTSSGSLVGAIVASESSCGKSQISSYIFPLLGIVSSILISIRIRTYYKNYFSCIFYY